MFTVGQSGDRIMGNLLGHQGQQKWQPNIPVNEVNDLNRPPSQQMTDMVLQFVVPLLCIASMSYLKYRQEADEHKLVEEHGKSKVKLEEELRATKEDAKRAASDLTYLKHGQEAEKQKLLDEHEMIKNKLEEELKVAKEYAESLCKPISDRVNELEAEETLNLAEELQELRYYEEGLETILDIRCSRFKTKESRTELQDELLNNAFISDSAVGKCVTFEGLQTIYNHDHIFCGRSREKNGKFRPLYVRQWKTQLELQKYRNIVKKLTQLKAKD